MTKQVWMSQKIETVMDRDYSVFMVQGTTSDAGKSTLVAGLCRLLVRAGRRVAPFKPQNMALNSAVTEDGGEIGRAQALQAEACYLKPHTDMNPILLKPSSDIGAQVIVHGQVYKAMDAEVYHDYKKVAMEAVLTSIDRLGQQYESIVVEGAGSPAEINLREGDIANMGFAEAVDCPVIIVADIDRGGVFAHLVGTLALLSQSEQDRVVGFVINRFRGDIGLLEPGLDWLEQKTGKPVLGVLPYLDKLYLDAEDAIDVAQELEAEQPLTVVVPVFARISNHTDFDVLRLHPQVDLILVRPGDPLPPADLVILPGSKSVRTDLALLREYGWDTAIYRHLRYGGKVLGICGGYQMLGQTVQDPQGIEGESGESEGLGLLPLHTVLMAEKQLLRVSGRITALDHDPTSYPIVSGYEIHCGETTSERSLRSFCELSDGREEGGISDDRQIIGTYLHGLFDEPESLMALLHWAGIAVTEPIDRAVIREQQLERLADILDAHLDRRWLDRILSKEA